MLDVINSIFSWIINGIQAVFNVISSIPKYLTYLYGWFDLIPNYMKAFIIMSISAVVIIKIKRLIF